jgi:hypothetical protein
VRCASASGGVSQRRKWSCDPHAMRRPHPPPTRAPPREPTAGRLPSIPASPVTLPAEARYAESDRSWPNGHWGAEASVSARRVMISSSGNATGVGVNPPTPTRRPRSPFPRTDHGSRLPPGGWPDAGSWHGWTGTRGPLPTLRRQGNGTHTSPSTVGGNLGTVVAQWFPPLADTEEITLRSVAVEHARRWRLAKDRRG